MATNTSNSRIPDTGSSVRFVRWNIKGMGRPIKRLRVFSHLKRLQADIVFLQGAHMRTTDQVRLQMPMGF